MNTQRSLIVILLAASLSLLACGGEEETAEETPTTAAPADEAPADEAPADEGGGGGGGGSACERARDCCNAYVDAVAANTPGVTAATACAGVQNATGPGADATCNAAISGWRTSLQAMSHDVPSSCQ
ncbi:MAG: hypothetical protein R3B82_10130 [Sandaracinaceae bacterium]